MNNNSNENKKILTDPVEDGTGRQCYAYVINVGGEPYKMAACGWWGTPDTMKHQACAMSAAARAFKKTASVLVYELCDDDNYYLCHSCDRQDRDRFLAFFQKGADPVAVYNSQAL